MKIEIKWEFTNGNTILWLGKFSDYVTVETRTLGQWNNTH